MGIKKTFTNLLNAVGVFGSSEQSAWWWGNVRIGKGTYVFKTNEKYYSAYDTNPLVFMVIDKQASVVSSLEQYFINQKGDKAENSPEQELWENPNKLQTRKDFIYQLITDLLIHGITNVYGIKPVGFGQFTEFHVMPTVCTQKQINSNKVVTRYDTYIEGIKTTITGDDIENVLELRMPSVSGAWESKSKLSVLGEAITSSTANLETEAFTYVKGGGVKMLTNESDLPMTPNQKKEAQDDFDVNNTGVANSGSVRITTAKLKAIDITRSPSELNLDPSLMAKLRLIAGVYGLDSKIFGDPTASTYSNMAEAIKAAFLQVFIPLCNDYIIKEFNSFWLAGTGSLLRMELDKDDIEEIKIADKASADTDYVRAQTLDMIMKMQISTDSKKAVLIEFGYSEEKALEITDVGEKNMQSEALKTFSPLIATKIMEKLTTQESRALIGLK